MKEYKIKINGNEYNVAINGIQNSVADVTVNGINYSVELENGITAPVNNGGAAPVSETKPTLGNAPQVQEVGKNRQETAEAVGAAAGKSVKSPLPGVIIEVSVREGESVKRGQKLAVLEAMKMENDILASQDGTVVKICVSKGDSILEGAEIAQIA